MASINRPATVRAAVNTARTHEGAAVAPSKPMQELRRTVLSCLLFEDTFYESGVSAADRITLLAGSLPLPAVLDLAVEARKVHGLRHVPLWLSVAALGHPERHTHRQRLHDTIVTVCDRADLPGELIAQYWAKGKRPLANVLKDALAASLLSFDEYRLAKYAKRGAIRPRDVLFLTHAKPPKDKVELFKALADDTLEAPDTWEVQLSAGGDKKAVFTDLLSRGKLGCLALLRNMRNMESAGVEKALVARQLAKMAPTARILPFQFIAAARACPNWEDILEGPMLASVSDLPKLPGKTVLLIDNSGSMAGKLSAKSTIDRLDGARALAILCREVCEDVAIASFNGSVNPIPARRGFGLADAVPRANGGTETDRAVKWANTQHPDRIVIFTDEQSFSPIGQPVKKGYIMNVAAYKNGIGWGKWITIDGFSDQLMRFMHEAENFTAE